MPMWKDMSRQLNDMLIGHEVGHALFTAMNAAEIVAFLKSVDSKHMDRVMQYLNVVEDARIDRLIQRKFPGLRKDYRAGYPEMMTRGFFGPMDADLAEYSLVDRINLNYKTDLNVPFDVVEQEFISRIDDVEDLDEVLEIVRDVYEYAQVHDSETVTPDMDMENEDGADAGEGDESGNENNAGSGEGSDSDESEGQEEGGSSSSNDSAEDGESSEANGSTVRWSPLLMLRMTVLPLSRSKLPVRPRWQSASPRESQTQRVHAGCSRQATQECRRMVAFRGWYVSS